MLDFRDYLQYAEKYLRMAEDVETSDLNWLLIPATILAWAAVEIFVNNRLSDFGALPEGIFELHEKAFLLEKQIRFVDSGEHLGEFMLGGTEYRRLEDKIFFLIAKSNPPNKIHLKSNALWKDFQEFKTDRDTLMHPRHDRSVVLTTEKVRHHIETSKNVIEIISKSLWNEEIEF